MQKTDTLPNAKPKSTLQDVLSRAASESSAVVHRRRAEDKTAVSDSQTQPAAHVVGGVVFEPVTRKPYDLSFSCLLIPRFSAHYLIGDIAESLREWMHQICISFAWRLEDIAVRPEYMQWVVYVPAATPPSRCIRTVREQTSRRIFDDFPHIRRENMSKDFWAPGYIVWVGPTLHPPEIIAEFIRLTRQQQGIQPRLSE
ncbi:MAG TPA: transposase [Anaerolineales bacterium]|nr:transposase [Anaerolineales bacterium]